MKRIPKQSISLQYFFYNNKSPKVRRFPEKNKATSTEWRQMTPTSMGGYKKNAQASVPNQEGLPGKGGSGRGAGIPGTGEEPLKG
jgi:hypothetical protein